MSMASRALLRCSLPRLLEGAARSLEGPCAQAALQFQLGDVASSASCELSAARHLHGVAASFRPPSTACDSQPSTSGGVSYLQQLSVQRRGHVRGMFIQTQPTPNPNSLMFVAGKQVMESGSHQFNNAREGMNSPLAKKLFAIDGVQSVFFGSDFITISKKEEWAWPVLKPDVFAAIMDYYSSGEPLFYDASHQASSDTAINEDDSEIVAMIKELLETRIRPAVQEDGGDIVFKGFEEDTGTVLVKLQGSCSTCPSSTVTLKGGIENMLKHYIPEVQQVIEAAPDETELDGIKEFEELDKKLEGDGSSSSSSSSSATASGTTA